MGHYFDRINFTLICAGIRRLVQILNLASFLIFSVELLSSWIELLRTFLLGKDYSSSGICMLELLFF